MTEPSLYALKGKSVGLPSTFKGCHGVIGSPPIKVHLGFSQRWGM